MDMNEKFEKWWEEFPWPRHWDYTEPCYHIARAAFLAGAAAMQEECARVATSKIKRKSHSGRHMPDRDKTPEEIAAAIRAIGKGEE